MCRLTPSTFTLLAFCGVVAMHSPTLAQQGKATLDNPQTAQPEQRPVSEALHVKAVDPKLEAVLNDWYLKTRDIQKLQGQHRRWTFEPVFQVAKVSSGKFYYEAPDRGRIDLSSDNPAVLAKSDVDPAMEGVQILQPGTPNVFTVKEDEGERWICDGTQIIRVDESEKTFEVVPIPAEHRGKNIMDGPLPFLFGLPPEKAKQRYNMTLRPSQQPNGIYLEVLPLQRNDASLWQKADVMLDATTYLPTAVRLLDNKGQGTTLYTFNDHEINAINILKIFGAGDPFKPNLFGYKQVQGPAAPPAGSIQQTGGVAKPAAGGVVPATNKAPAEAMPSLIGLGHKEATEVLKRRGHQTIKLHKGPVTTNPALRYHVAEQTPSAGANAAEGEIVLVLHVFAEDLQKSAEKPE